MNEIHREPLFNCDLCPESFKSRWFLKKHFQDCHLERVEQWKCDPCSEQFQHEIDFQNHNRIVHSEDMTKCEYDEKPLNMLEISNPVKTLMVFRNENK